MNLHNIDFLKLFKIIGVVMLLLACSTAILLYSSFGHSTTEKIVYAGIGLVFAVLSAALLPAAVYVGKRDNIFFAVLCFIAWMIMAFLGMNTHLGFFAVSQSDLEQENAAKSVEANVAKSSIESATNKVEMYSSFAAVNVGELQVKQDNLQSQLTELRDKLAKCPANYLTACINPTKEKIKHVENQLTPLNEELKGFENYQAAIALKSNALSDLKTALNNGSASISETIHPLFIQQAHWLGGDVRFLQARFLAISAIAFELLTAFIWALIGLLDDSKNKPYKMIGPELLSTPSAPVNHTLPKNETSATALLKNEISASATPNP
jgi:hypothetical protein